MFTMRMHWLNSRYGVRLNCRVKYFKTKPFDTLLELQDSIGGLNSYTSSKYPSINNEFCTTTLNNIFEEGMDVKDALKQSQETLENEFGDK